MPVNVLQLGFIIYIVQLQDWKNRKKDRSRRKFNPPKSHLPRILVESLPIGKQLTAFKAVPLIITPIKRNLLRAFGLRHIYYVVKVDIPRSPPFADRGPVATFSIHRHVRKGVLLRVDPLVRDDVGIGVADLILHEDIDAVAQMQPPEAAMLGIRRRLLAIVLKGHLAQLVEAVRLVQHVEGAPVQLLVALGQTREAGRKLYRRLGVLTERDDVGARDGKDVLGLEGFPDCVDFGAAFRARVGWVVGSPERTVDLHVVELDGDVFEDGGFGRELSIGRGDFEAVWD